MESLLYMIILIAYDKFFHMNTDPDIQPSPFRHTHTPHLTYVLERRWSFSGNNNKLTFCLFAHSTSMHTFSCFRCLPKATPMAYSSHLISSLFPIIDFLHRNHFRGEEVSKFGQVDSISQSFFQLCCGRQLLIQAGLHPSGSARTTK